MSRVWKQMETSSTLPIIDSSFNLDLRMKELHEELKRDNERSRVLTNSIRNSCLQQIEDIKNKNGGRIPPLTFQGRMLE